MIRNIPVDLKAETLLGYLPKETRQIEVRGSHKRNAYEDITCVSDEPDGLTITLARNGLYDALPESLFHPIDRFDNIPANEYKERFKEECERQQLEEENARKYFHPFDSFLIELSTSVANIKNGNGTMPFITDIICDRLPEDIAGNRFVKRAKEYIPHCSRIRGNDTLFALMLRRILLEEGLTLTKLGERTLFKDSNPKYAPTFQGDQGDEELFLGNEFEEEVTVYRIKYWNEDECDESFLKFVSEMKVFEDFLNDYFLGLETRLTFDISTDGLPVRLGDEMFYTYLNYNTNI